jgi:GWxTD domain-containing protein
MKTVYAFVFSLLVILVSGSCSKPPAPSRQNHSFEYAMETAVQHDLRAEGDSLHVYLRFADSTFFARPQHLRVAYAAYLNYESNDQSLVDSINAPLRKLVRNASGVYFDFKIARQKLKLPAVLLVKISNRNDQDHVLVHDIALTEANWKKNYVVQNGATGLPLFRNFIVENETVIISAFGGSNVGELVRYEYNFTPALPPMILPEKQKATPTIKPLETLVFSDKPVFLLKPGLYGIKLENKVVDGILKMEGTFPELTAAPDLIAPLIYLTTSAEREKLYKSPDPKAALDKFWLNISPNQNHARRLIKTFYRHVAVANFLFTAHKPGWQTDRGMIYVVFGPPDMVRRSEGSEEWLYLATTYHNEVRFVFSRKDNTFTQNYYELVRSPGFEAVWYGTVEQWRNGIIEK